MGTAPEGFVKLILHGPDGEVETPWAERVGDRLFRLDNLPWFAYGVSDDDIVEADETDDEGVFEFVRVVTPSGNRLLRVIFESEGEAVEPLEELVALGCHYEGANALYVAVSIPPQTDLDTVAASLTERGVQREYAIPSYEEVMRG